MGPHTHGHLYISYEWYLMDMCTHGHKPQTQTTDKRIISFKLAIHLSVVQVHVFCLCPCPCLWFITHTYDIYRCPSIGPYPWGHRQLDSQISHCRDTNNNKVQQIEKKHIKAVLPIMAKKTSMNGMATFRSSAHIPVPQKLSPKDTYLQYLPCIINFRFSRNTKYIDKKKT